MITLSIDPGKNFCAWSFAEGNQLLKCCVSVRPKRPMELGAICEYHWLNVPPIKADRVIVERMQLRKIDGAASRLVALANDLFQLQSVGAYIAGRAHAELVYVPHFAVPKLITKNRVLHLLSPREHDVLAAGAANMKKLDDLFDSVGLLLRAVGRMG